MKKNFLLSFPVCLILFFFMYSSCLAAEFSADSIQSYGGQTMKGKLFVKGGKVRMEMPGGGMNQITIMDLESRKSYMVLEEQKAYMEIPWPAEMAATMESKEEMAKQGEWKDLGTETVNGYSCEKRAFVYKDKSMGEMTQWFSTKLNYPIKMIHKGKQGEMLSEYMNIREGGVLDSLFQVPAGYGKMEMPGFGQGRMPGMSK